MGIRDSRQKKEFITSDFNPSIENFRLVPAGVGFFVPKDSEECRGICSVDLFEHEIKPVITSPGGVLRQLRLNLARFGLTDLVAIHTGDFDQVDNVGYRFIFCDAMHDPDEISLNAPKLRPYLSRGAVLACHDSSPANEECIRSYFPIGHSFTVDSLFVGEVV